jgi:hypothetical protein
MSNTLHGDLNKLTLENNNYRKVINTTKKQQLVLMSLKPKEEKGGTFSFIINYVLVYNHEFYF